MNMNEYQELQMRTASEAAYTDMITNAALGLAGESGEVCDIVKKAKFQGHKLDVEHVIEELGDVLWYVSLGAKGCGITLDELAQRNIDKLRKRFPDGFDAERSVNR